MFNYVATNNFIKLAICEGIRNDAEIVNYICLGPRIGIDTDRTRMFILTTADVENPWGRI